MDANTVEAIKYIVDAAFWLVLLWLVLDTAATVIVGIFAVIQGSSE